MQEEERVFNFSAGPAVLPVPVLKKIQEELLCLPGCGASILEISHRSKQFGEILAQAKANVRELLGVPENYKILFLQGGALTHFAMLPMNFIRNTNKSGNYLVTGNWSKKSASEAKTQGAVKVIWDGKEEGYVQIHDIFMETSKNEREHAKIPFRSCATRRARSSAGRSILRNTAFSSRAPRRTSGPRA